MAFTDRTFDDFLKRGLLVVKDEQEISDDDEKPYDKRQD
jgi:hypothetical protein